MQRRILFFILACSPFPLLAQYGATVTGQVMDKAKPLASANVLLINSTDSSHVRTAVTDTLGWFSIKPVLPGSYRLHVSYIGYQIYTSKLVLVTPSVQVLDAGTIVLLPDNSTQLKGVTVTAVRPFVEHKLDRTVINVDALVTNQGISAFDVLEKSPGIMIDPVNGSISLEGRQGVTVYIDNRRSYLTGADLAAYLQSLPSGSVEQFELMTNPPARYDAEGGPVINIRLKKNIVKGFNGGATALYGHWKYGKTDERYNFDYRHGKFNLFGYGGLNQQNNYHENNQTRQYLNADGSTQSNFSQTNFTHNTGYTLSPQLGLDYYASAKTTWGIWLNEVYRPATSQGQTITDLLDASNNLDSSVNQNFTNNRIFRTSHANLNYRRQFNNNGRELTADADYDLFAISSGQSFNNTTALPDHNIAGQSQETGNTPSQINIYAFKADYAHPLKNGYKFETGVKTSITNTDNTANYFNIINSVSQPDYTKTNHFLYDENINALYVNATKEWKKLSAEAGMRVENTISHGNQLGNVIIPDSSFNRSYTGLFPTMFLQYKLDSLSKNQLGLTFGRRINRPYYQDLNPFIIPADNFNYSAGNPYLKPSYSSNIEMSYVYKNNLTIKFFYAKTSGDMQQVNVLKNGIIYNTIANLGYASYEGMSAGATLAPAKWFSLNGFAQVKFEHTQGVVNNDAETVYAVVGYVDGNMQFKLGNGWNAELSGFWQSKTRNIQFNQGAFGRLNAVLQKKLSNSFSARLVCTDFLKLLRYSGTYRNLLFTNASFSNSFDSRGVSISVNYRFGKMIKDLRRHKDDATDSEQGRVKN